MYRLPVKYRASPRTTGRPAGATANERPSKGKSRPGKPADEEVETSTPHHLAEASGHSKNIETPLRDGVAFPALSPVSRRCYQRRSPQKQLLATGRASLYYQ